jgi:8-oxo-dGTP pyrophosphatase MutT (NUDIX family)
MNNQHRSAHILAFDQRSRFLLVKRGDVPIWVMPGGTAEPGEDPLQTAVREFREETHINLSKKNLKLAAEYTLSAHACKKSKLVFVTTLPADTKPQKTNEAVAYGFFKPENLPTPMSLYEQRKVMEAFAVKHGVLIRPDQVNPYVELASLSIKQAFYLLALYIFHQLKRSYVNQLAALNATNT